MDSVSCEGSDMSNMDLFADFAPEDISAFVQSWRGRVCSETTEVRFRAFGLGTVR
jgi:hypothetical protein